MHAQTVGYLAGFLEYMWKENGILRPSKCNIEADIEQVAKHGILYSRVKVFCSELGQQFLQCSYAERLKSIVCLAITWAHTIVGKIKPTIV